MAEPIKTAKGYRMPLCVKGQREERVFPTKREAIAWRDKRVPELRALAGGDVDSRKTLRDAMRKYAQDVTPEHKGQAWELVRLAALERDPVLPVTIELVNLTPAHLARWKEARGKEVAPGTVLREMGLLSSVLGYARRDWHWMAHSPMSDVRRPPQPKARDHLLTWTEIRTMLRGLGWKRGRLSSMKQLTGAAFLLCLRTGMRCSEATGLTWYRVYPHHAALPFTKNGTARDVPLPPKAARLIERLRGLDEERVLPITSASVDVMFRRARHDAGLAGFVFHDSRHHAATRIGRIVGHPGKLSFVEFCRAFGWRDPKMAMRYVNPSAADLAGKM